MAVLKAGLVFLLHSALLVTAQKTELLKPCKINDMECIRDTTQQFMEKTSKGVPEHGLKAIDPLEVEKLDYDLPEFGSSHHVTNLKIVGLKNVQITEFKMDTESKKVTISLNISVVAEGDLAVDYHVKPETKTVTGHYNGDFKFLATTSYPYSVRQGEDGVQHYEIGQEVTTFQLRGTPDYVLSKDFTDAVSAGNAFLQDPQLSEARSKILATKRAELVRAVAKQLVEVTVSTLVQNLRQAAKILPMSAFFTSE